MPTLLRTTTPEKAARGAGGFALPHMHHTILSQFVRPFTRPKNAKAQLFPSFPSELHAGRPYRVTQHDGGAETSRFSSGDCGGSGLSGRRSRSSGWPERRLLTGRAMRGSGGVSGGAGNGPALRGLKLCCAFRPDQLHCIGIRRAGKGALV